MSAATAQIAAPPRSGAETAAREYAAAYAALGWPVFPLRPGSKSPATPHGFHDAATDAQAIAAFPAACNLGIATGAAFWVLDIDGPQGRSSLEALEAQHGELPRTLEARTRNGGRHLVFQAAPGVRSRTGVRPGIDVRGDGGYIAAEPSEVAADDPAGTGRYAWLDWEPTTGEVPDIAPAPEWLLELVQDKPTHQAERAHDAGALHVDGATVADLRSAIAVLDADDYTVWIAAAHYLRELGDTGFAIWDEWAQRSAKHDPAVSAEKWASIQPLRKAHGYRGLFQRAQGAGWVNPRASTSPTAPAHIEDLPLSLALDRARHLLMPAEDEQGLDDYPLEALGPLAQAAADLSAGGQIAPAMAGQSMLAAAALLAQSVANVQTLDGSPKPLSLYCLTVANSGDGKDTADRPALRAIHDFQRRAGRQYEQALRDFEDAKASRKKGDPLPEDIGPAPYRITSDLTIEGLRRSFMEGIAAQGVFSTEAGAVLAGHSMSQDHRTKTAANLCGLWDRGHISVVRAMGGRSERYGVRLSAHLLIQPAALGDILGDDVLSGIGFWPRFLLAWPAPLAPRRYKPWKPDSSSAIREYWRRCEGLLARPVPEDCDELPALMLSADATERMKELFELMEREGRRGGLRDVRAFALRATELAYRIAGVLTVFEGADEIDEAAARAGASLATHSLDNWQDALHGRADPVPGWALTLYRWLAERGVPVALRDIPRIGPASVRPAARRDEALDRLKTLGLAAIEGGNVHALGVRNASD